jgi:hypothetical protein
MSGRRLNKLSAAAPSGRRCFAKLCDLSFAGIGPDFTARASRSFGVSASKPVAILLAVGGIGPASLHGLGEREHMNVRTLIAVLEPAWLGKTGN